ncbi:MAG: hypothetical protein ACOH2L_19230, partial [Devosia sp.]
PHIQLLLAQQIPMVGFCGSVAGDFGDGMDKLIVAIFAGLMSLSLSAYAATAVEPQVVEPNGVFQLPMECTTQNEVAQLESGDLGSLYFEITSASTCRFMEDLDNVYFHAEACDGPAMLVTFLSANKSPVRQRWLPTRSFIQFLSSQEMISKCIEERTQWGKESS